MTSIKGWEWFSLTVIAALIVFFVQDNIFFWDTVQLAGKHGSWFYEQPLGQFILPTEIDSGHPPLFGKYLAIVWTLFGKSLQVSHWAMFPFILALMIGLLHWVKKIFNNPLLYMLAFGVLIFDPFLAGQMVLVSPDLLLITCLVWATIAITEDRKWLLVLLNLIMALTSTRGMMIVLALYIITIFWKVLVKKEKLSLVFLFREMIPYFLAGGSALIFLIHHYLATGWIGYHEESPWAPGFKKADAKGVLRNAAVLIWRFLDFGRVILWGGLFYLLFRFNRKGGLGAFYKKIDSLLKFWLLSFLILTLSLSVTFLLYKLLQHNRYLLPSMLAFNFLFLYLLSEIESETLKRIGLSIALGAFIWGNTWIYPDKISQGWDSTLAHLSYYQLRQEMITEVETQNISFSEIGTAFPDIGAFKHRDLSGREEGFSKKDLNQQVYILYSNIMNDFTDEELDRLENNWLPIITKKKRGIKMILYKKKD
ncbi:MAG: hypothetical protein AAFO07_05340 [Bacteroidota bacterium]